jgi:hypothetical protein
VNNLLGYPRALKRLLLRPAWRRLCNLQQQGRDVLIGSNRVSTNTNRIQDKLIF